MVELSDCYWYKLPMANNDQIQGLLTEVISGLRGDSETNEVLGELFAETARDAAAKKLAIALFLSKHKSYAEIKSTLGVSSSTIAKIQDSMDSPGMKAVLKKLAAEEWANIWAGKISRVFTKLLDTH